MVVRRVDVGSREACAKIYAENEPVVLAGMANRWKAAGTWSPERLREACGHRQCAVEHYPTGNRTALWTYRKMSLGEYLDKIETPGQERLYYFAETPVGEAIPELAGELDFAAMLQPSHPIVKTVLFFGKDTFTPMHFHRGMHAVLAQLYGRKRVLLYAPSQTSAIPTNPWYSFRNNFSKSASEADALPANATPIEVVLEPGDALFIPIHWWHVVFGLGTSVSATVFWKAPLRSYTFPHPGLRDLASAPLRRGQLVLAERAVKHGLVGPLAAFAEKVGIVENRKVLEDMLANR